MICVVNDGKFLLDTRRFTICTFQDNNSHCKRYEFMYFWYSVASHKPTEKFICMISLWLLLPKNPSLSLSLCLSTIASSHSPTKKFSHNMNSMSIEGGNWLILNRIDNLMCKVANSIFHITTTYIQSSQPYNWVWEYKTPYRTYLLYI